MITVIRKCVQSRRRRGNNGVGIYNVPSRPDNNLQFKFRVSSSGRRLSGRPAKKFRKTITEDENIKRILLGAKSPAVSPRNTIFMFTVVRFCPFRYDNIENEYRKQKYGLIVRCRANNLSVDALSKNVPFPSSCDDFYTHVSNVIIKRRPENDFVFRSPRSLRTFCAFSNERGTRRI